MGQLASRSADVAVAADQHGRIITKRVKETSYGVHNGAQLEVFGLADVVLARRVRQRRQPGALRYRPAGFWLCLE